MKPLLRSAALVLVLGVPLGAEAADVSPRLPTKAPPLSPVPYYNWTGLYLGINGGGAFGSVASSDALHGIVTSFPTSGGLFGGTLGYNFQSGGAVLGLEGDVDWAGASGSSGPINGVNYQNYLQWISTVRGRVGIAVDRFLPYLTGGLAIGNSKETITAPPTLLSGSNTGVGWAVGAGLEYGITPNVSLKAEYLFVDLGPASPIAGERADVKSNVVRGGVNWRFNWDGPPHF
jgi:outer membrane immunogenic protein